jgi:hypothetical protein
VVQTSCRWGRARQLRRCVSCGGGRWRIAKASVTAGRAARAAPVVFKGAAPDSEIGKLIAASRMDPAWRELRKHIKDDSTWRAWWLGIEWARDEVREPRLPRSAEHSAAKRISVEARKLAYRVDALWPGLTVANLMSSRPRLLLARSAPTVGRALRRLANVSATWGKEALSEPRLFERRRGRDWEVKALLKALVVSHQMLLGKKLYGVVSAVASVLLDRDITKEQVESASRGKRGHAKAR